jgi:hypothetical protein
MNALSVGAGGLMVLSALHGCAGAPSPPTNGTSDTNQASAFAVDITATILDEMPTMIRVRWETPDKTVGFVEFGTTSDLDYSTRTEADAALSHERLLIGVPARTEVYYRVVSELDGERLESAVQTITTGLLPPEVPDFTVTPGAVAHGWTVLPFSVADGDDSGRSAVLILDPEGRLVWFHVLEPGAPVTRVRMTPDGTRLVFQSGEAYGYRSLDMSAQDTVLIPESHHDFELLDDGTLVGIVEERQPRNEDGSGDEMVADKVVEVSPDGTERVVWSAFDYLEELGFDPNGSEGGEIFAADDITHANAINYDPFTGNYLVDLPGRYAVVGVARDSGALSWVFHADALVGLAHAGTDPHRLAHEVVPTAEGFSLFVNATDTDECATVVDYAIDVDAGTATELSRHRRPECTTTFGLGGVRRLDDDHLLVSWATSGVVTELDAAGQVVLEVFGPFGMAVGYSASINDLPGALP